MKEEWEQIKKARARQAKEEKHLKDVKKDVKEWEKEIDNLLNNESMSRTTRNTLEELTHAMMAINL